MSGASGPSTAPNARRADRRQRDARGIRDRCRRDADALQRLVPAVARQERARRDDDAGTQDRQTEHEVPGWRRRVEALGQVVPQPVLQLVDRGHEERCDERRGNTDERAEPDQAERLPTRDRRGRLGCAHTSPRAAQAHAVSTKGGSGSVARQRSRSSACRSGSSRAGVGAGRADAERERLPPVLEGRMLDAHSRARSPRRRAAPPPRTARARCPARAPASPDSSSTLGVELARGVPEHAQRARPPAWSQTQAATTPPRSRDARHLRAARRRGRP